MKRLFFFALLTLAAVLMLALSSCAIAPGPYEPYVPAPYVYGYQPSPVVFFYNGD